MAQEKMWNVPGEKMQPLKDKGTKKVSVIKGWKEHILKWGLDSNYNHSLSVGAKLNTTGWTGGVYYLHQRKAGVKTLWQLQFSEIKHEKEIKQQRSGDAYRDLGTFRPFFAGKVNYCYTLQLGYGREQLLFPALLDGNLSVGFRYAVGSSIALLKPVYLNLIYTEFNPDVASHIQSESYNKTNADKFLKPSEILGADKWSRGIGDIKIIPGAFAEAVVALEPDRPKAFVKTILIGGQFAYYSQKITIMADRKAYPWEAALFVGINLGKKWK